MAPVAAGTAYPPSVPHAYPSVVPQAYPPLRVSSYRAPKWSDDLTGFWVVLLYVVACSAVGLFFVVPGLEDHNLRLALFITQPILTAFIVGLLVLLQQMDPGIVPPALSKDHEIVAAEAGRLSPDIVVDSHRQWARGRVLPDGRTEITQRYCSTCHIWREPRTSHCSRCGYCMERYDHHCGALGVCIARKNHRFFTLLLFAVSIASALFLAACIVRLMQFQYIRSYLLLPTQVTVSSTTPATTNAFMRRLDYASAVAESTSTALVTWSTGESFLTAVLLLVLSLVYLYTSLLFFFAVMHCSLLMCDCTTKRFIIRNRASGSGQGGGKGIFVESGWPSLGAWCTNLHSACCGGIRNKRSLEPVPPRAVSGGLDGS